MTDAENGTSTMGNALLATSDILLTMELVWLTAMLPELVMWLETLIAKYGTMEFARNVPSDIGLMPMEFARLLLINAIPGIMLMDFASVAIKDMILLMEFVSFLPQILKDLLILDVKLGIREFALSAHPDGS